jgi:Fe-S-cluster containining protein
MDRALDEIYAEIPSIPDCTGQCADACGPIAMTSGEWDRIKRIARRTPKMKQGSMVCPLLSPTGKCTTYTLRPLICRLWGATPQLACPQGCKPERWLSRDEARDIFERVAAVAGPGTDGPLGKVDDLWSAIALEAREERAAIIDRIKEAANASIKH